MKLYVDDDSTTRVLIKHLRRAGHDVQLPVDVGKAGADDCVHLTHAALTVRIMLTQNHGDFENLHKLVQAVGGQHPGLLLVRKDANPKNNMSERDIVTAIGKLANSGIPIANDIHTLNLWR